MSMEVTVSWLQEGYSNPEKKSWHVNIGRPSDASFRAVRFTGHDAQRLAYEYAAGVLGKKECEPRPFRWGGFGENPLSAPPPSAPSLAASAAAKPASPWISVKEKAPEARTPVLTWYPIDPTGMSSPFGLGYYKDGMWWELVRGVPTARITHWMPLPEPPKE